MNAAFGALKRHVDAAFASVASEIARQSRVELGKDSIAKKQGFRSPVALIQATTGSSVGEAIRPRGGRSRSTGSESTPWCGSSHRPGSIEEASAPRATRKRPAESGTIGPTHAARGSPIGEAARQTAVVIDDDADVRDLLVQVLTSAGFHVFAVDNGFDGVDAVRGHDPDITTLDVNMPGIDGYETARRIREHSNTYILLITALTEEADAVLGFSVGADDVVTKPFRARELRARVLAAQRRRPRGSAPAGADSARDADPQPAPVAVLPSATPSRLSGNAGLVVDRATHSVTIDGHPVLLTRTEFELLATLLEAAPEVRSKAHLAGALRPGHGGGRSLVSDADERAIETHMTNLRRKLGDSVAEPRFIETLRAVGYRAIVPGGTPSTSTL